MFTIGYIIIAIYVGVAFLSFIDDIYENDVRLAILVGLCWLPLLVVAIIFAVFSWPYFLIRYLRKDQPRS
jgi:hypothetical protein